MEKIYEIGKEILVVIGMLCVGLILVGGIRSCMKHVDKNEYNDGICQKCGGHLEYEQAVGHQYFTTYMYKCENCGKRIELNYNPD